MKDIKDYIPEFKRYICNNCADCTCTRSCVIWADAIKALDDDTADRYFLKKYSRDILGYFRYYADKYSISYGTTADGRKTAFIEIPVMDGSNSLDHYFINVLTANKWTYKHDWLLNKIYLIYMEG